MVEKTIVFVKGEHQFIFRYDDEAMLLDALVDMVRQRVAGFDWFDAATVSYNMRKA